MPPSVADEPINCHVDDAFTAMLVASGGSLLLSAYQANRMVSVACHGDRLNLPMFHLDRPMGISLSGTTLAIGLRDRIVLLEQAPGTVTKQLQEQLKCDALFMPRMTYHTGELATHDLAINSSGDFWFLNTHFSCLCRMNPKLSFEPVWQPPFITQLAPEDRCHLNGLALVDGQPKYATCLGEADTYTGWRENKLSGGCLIDIQSNQVIARGLSMPHSPRWHDGRLWMLNSATGELVTVDVNSARQTVVATLPGYLRGLEFIGSTALVGMSVIRSSHMLGSLPVQHKFPEMLCGVAAIDLRSGAVLGMLRFMRGCAELFEVKFLPGIQRPVIGSG